ncbi:hypothetical protein FXO38_34972 [Capsicum annuum]|nr:hypothetical protein FXO38_34972 [Capsicum annuum]KAF3615940.1 hypothetical protein FXO37_35292 [Capsicum annuum]
MVTKEGRTGFKPRMVYQIGPWWGLLLITELGMQQKTTTLEEQADPETSVCCGVVYSLPTTHVCSQFHRGIIVVRVCAPYGAVAGCGVDDITIAIAGLLQRFDNYCNRPIVTRSDGAVH